MREKEGLREIGTGIKLSQPGGICQRVIEGYG